MKFTTDHIYILLFIALILGLIIYKKNKIVDPRIEAIWPPRYNSCRYAPDCNKCINAQINNTNPSNAMCYWNSKQNKCGSFKDPGYSRTCGSTGISTSTGVSISTSNSTNTGSGSTSSGKRNFQWWITTT